MNARQRRLRLHVPAPAVELAAVPVERSEMCSDPAEQIFVAVGRIAAPAAPRGFSAADRRRRRCCAPRRKSPCQRGM
eukprot:1415562-Alexandrium_andersonii.AAC.1